MPTFPNEAVREVLVVSIARPPSHWTEAIAEISNQFQNARVCFYRETDGDDDYDPIDQTGNGPGVEVIWAGAARVQQLRAPQKFATDYQDDSSKAFIFELSKAAGVPYMPQGTQARVINAGVPGAAGQMTPGDQHLSLLAFVVDANVSASHQAVNTVELTANMKPVRWDWTIDDSGVVIPFP